MKSFNEFKGYQTRTSFDVASKSFISAPVQHMFLQTLTNTSVVEHVETPAVVQFDIQRKIAA